MTNSSLKIDERGQKLFFLAKWDKLVHYIIFILYSLLSIYSLNLLIFHNQILGCLSFYIRLKCFCILPTISVQYLIRKSKTSDFFFFTLCESNRRTNFDVFQYIWFASVPFIDYVFTFRIRRKRGNRQSIDKYKNFKTSFWSFLIKFIS